MRRVEYAFDPGENWKQALALKTHVDELLYGGAAGGGKSAWARAEAVRMAILVPGSRTVLFRRTFPDLQRDVIPKLLAEMPRGVAKYNKSEHVWYFNNGSIVELGHMQNDTDYYAYQSAEYQLIIFEELTQFLKDQYLYLMSRLRAAGAVRDRMAELGWRPRVIATCNPGGIGHSWTKERWYDYGIQFKPWQPPITADEPNPGIRCYIPAFLSDNPHVDPDYTNRLDQLDPEMRRALKFGDWDILKGVRFSSFRRSLHVVEPEDVPLDLIGHARGVGVDYGMVDPFCALWGAALPDRRLVVYRELYGVEFTAAQQAQMMRDSEADGERQRDRPLPIALDPSAWIRQSNSTARGVNGAAPVGSTAWAYQEVFPGAVRQARNDRIAGWSLIDELLRVRDDGRPGLLIYSTCTNLIRELPSQMRSKTHPEDLVATGPGHADACDALRYLCWLLVGGGHMRVAPPLRPARALSPASSLASAQF